jgi:hypothetical protein
MVKIDKLTLDLKIFQNIFLHFIFHLKLEKSHNTFTKLLFKIVKELIFDKDNISIVFSQKVKGSYHKEFNFYMVQRSFYNATIINFIAY